MCVSVGLASVSPTLKRTRKGESEGGVAGEGVDMRRGKGKARRQEGEEGNVEGS